MISRYGIAALLLAGCAARDVIVVANDNRIPAGRQQGDTLVAELVVREGTWFPDDSTGASLRILAFAEGDGVPRNPGPLLRGSQGAALRIRVRNTLGKPVVVHGLHSRPGRDSLVLGPGVSREVRFAAGEPGTYYYWASTDGHAFDERENEDSQLGGAFVVDPQGSPSTDRVFVIGGWFADGDTAARPVLPIRDVMTINGRAWPHTERVTATLGDSISWRVINTNLNSHPMHLHGTYFTVESRGDWSRDTAYAPHQRALEVTELMLPGATMTMRWAPQRPGNWLLHCHFAFHVSPFTSLTRTLAGDTLPHGDHVAERAMAGLVLGVNVPAPEGFTEPPDTAAPRDIRLLVQSRPGVFGKAPGFGFIVPDAREPARDSITMPGTPLVLERGRPVRITVVNHLDQQTAVHWHGIELPSYPDGVPGWSGMGSRIMPPIAPGDSFVAEFTPPRSGTFIYHAHANEMEQLSQGLYGALLVVEPGTRPDPRREATVLASLDGPTSETSKGWVNGGSAPPVIRMPAGRQFKLRLISINTDYRVRFRLLSDSTMQSWRPVALDGADLPPSLATSRPAEWLSGPGMTQDVMIEGKWGQRFMVEVSAPFATEPWVVLQPIVVQ